MMQTKPYVFKKPDHEQQRLVNRSLKISLYSFHAATSFFFYSCCGQFSRKHRPCRSHLGHRHHPAFVQQKWKGLSVSGRPSSYDEISDDGVEQVAGNDPIVRDRTVHASTSAQDPRFIVARRLLWLFTCRQQQSSRHRQ